MPGWKKKCMERENKRQRERERVRVKARTWRREKDGEKRQNRKGERTPIPHPCLSHRLDPSTRLYSNPQSYTPPFLQCVCVYLTVCVCVYVTEREKERAANCYCNNVAISIQQEGWPSVWHTAWLSVCECVCARQGGEDRKGGCDGALGWKRMRWREKSCCRWETAGESDMKFAKCVCNYRLWGWESLKFQLHSVLRLKHMICWKLQGKKKKIWVTFKKHKQANVPWCVQTVHIWLYSWCKIHDCKV